MKRILKTAGIIVALVFVLASVVYIYQAVNFNSYTSVSYTGVFKVPVNKSAPVVSQSFVTIKAPAQKVFAVLSDINNWPQWQKDVTSAKLQGPPEEGAVFLWEAGGLSFESRIHTLQPGLVLGWTGKTFGAYAVHNWQFTEIDSTTTVTVSESLQGFFPALMPGFFQKSLNKGVVNNLQELKAAAESK